MSSRWSARTASSKPVTWEEAFEHDRQTLARNSRQRRRPVDRRHRLQPHHQRRELPAAEVRAHGAAAPTISTITAPPTTPLSPRRWPASRTRRPRMRDVSNAPAILLIGNDPTEQHPLLAWKIRTNVRLNRAQLVRGEPQPIKLRRQAKAFVQIPAGREGKLVAFLGGDDCRCRNAYRRSGSNDALTQLRDELQAEQRSGHRLRLRASRRRIAALVDFGAAFQRAKFVCLGDYANSRGAADMGLSRPASRLRRRRRSRHIRRRVGQRCRKPGLDLAGDVRRSRSAASWPRSTLSARTRSRATTSIRLR